MVGIERGKNMKLRDQHPVFFLYILGVILSLVACAGSGANLPQRTTQQPTAILQTSTATSPPAAGGIKGTVQEAQTGKAIATAYIVFQSEDGAVRLDTFSDANGDYTDKNAQRPLPCDGHSRRLSEQQQHQFHRNIRS